jgi:copper chaperone
MKTKDLIIEGMTCGHCIMNVKKELAKLAGVRVESVEIGKGRVQYDESLVSHRDFERAIDNAGYRLITEKLV